MIKGVSLDLWEFIGICTDSYRSSLYLALSGIPRLREESRLKRIRKALIREEKANWVTSWRLDGKLHQEDNLPAIINTEGTKYWFKNGKRHREKGQAIITYGKSWYNNGIQYFSPPTKRGKKKKDQ